MWLADFDIQTSGWIFSVFLNPNESTESVTSRFPPKMENSSTPINIISTYSCLFVRSPVFDFVVFVVCSMLGFKVSYIRQSFSFCLIVSNMVASVSQFQPFEISVLRLWVRNLNSYHFLIRFVSQLIRGLGGENKKWAPNSLPKVRGKLFMIIYWFRGIIPDSWKNPYFQWFLCWCLYMQCDFVGLYQPY